MNRQQMIQKIDAIHDLPTLPTIALEINRMFQDINTPIDQVVDLLQRDQSMALKILKLVNSSFYGFKSRILNLRHAITLMGYNTVRHAVVTVAVIDSLKISSALKGFDISRFWTHSIGVAVMCRHLARRTRLAGPEEAFTAGLVHDIGKVVLANHFPTALVALNEAASADGISFYAAEKAGGTYPHNLIGSGLARRWMLPEPLGEAIRHHHGGTGRHPEDALTGLVAVSDTIVNVMHTEPGHRLGADTIPEAIRDPVTETMADSADWFPGVRQEMAAACAFFNKG